VVLTSLFYPVNLPLGSVLDLALVKVGFVDGGHNLVLLVPCFSFDDGLYFLFLLSDGLLLITLLVVERRF